MVAVRIRRNTAAVARKMRPARPSPVPVLDNCCSKSSLGRDVGFRPLNLFDCATVRSFGACGAQKDFAMIETVTAVMGLVSAGIFLAHAFEGFRSRA
jgi:hypothetical protein